MPKSSSSATEEGREGVDIKCNIGAGEGRPFQGRKGAILVERPSSHQWSIGEEIDRHQSIEGKRVDGVGTTDFHVQGPE